MPGSWASMDILLNVLAWIGQHPHLSGVLFVALTAGVMAIGVPGGNLLLLASGMLFGWVPGALLVTLGLALAALSTHLLIRSAFGRWLEQRAERGGWLSRRELHTSSALLLMLPRLVPVVPFFALNALYAMAGVPRWPYLWTTVLGVLPIALLVARIGSRFHDMEELAKVDLVPMLLSADVLLPLVLLALLTLSAWWALRRQQAG